MAKMAPEGQTIRLWLKFYRLACEDPKYSETAAKSKPFYDAWEKPAGMQFHAWWFTKGRLLFSDPHEVTVLNQLPERMDPALIYVALPRARSPSNLLKALRPMLANEVGPPTVSKKHKTVSKAKFGLTAGTELRPQVIASVYEVYRFWLKKGRPPINKNFLEAVRRMFRGPGASPIPSVFGSDRGVDVALDTHLRNLRRYIHRGEKLVANAARGVFPGK
jgi:hypothetical protein